MVVWEASLTSVTHYFRHKWLASLPPLTSLHILMQTANKSLTVPYNTSLHLPWCAFCWSACVEDRACYKLKLRGGWNKKCMKRLRGLTGMWLDWHWCDVGDFLTQTCLQGWHCSQRDNNVAFLHQQLQPALILSECLSSSGKTWDPCQSVSLVHGNVISPYLRAIHSNPLREINNQRRLKSKRTDSLSEKRTNTWLSF